MSRDPRKRQKNNIKGRVAEAIVETLLDEAGNQVRRFGQEWCTTALEEINAEMFRYVDIGRKRKIKPDFAVRNKKHELELVEVKFMESDFFLPLLKREYLDDLLKYWPKTRIVVVTVQRENVIQVITPPYRISIGMQETTSITNIPEWGISSGLVEKYYPLLWKLPMEELRIKRVIGRELSVNGFQGSK